MKEFIEIGLIKAGIEGDINSSTLSPRQVLLADEQTMHGFGIKAGDFRENITTRDFDLNNLKSGTVLSIGENAKIRITFTCEPCSYINTLNIKNAGNILGKRGMLGCVIQAGIIKQGDIIEIDTKVRYSEVPFKFSERFNWVMEKIPEGKVATYATLLESIGGSTSYMRAFPALIKRAIKLGLPGHRILDSQFELIKHVENQLVLLKAEGVEIDSSKTNLEKYIWDASNLYL